MATQVTSLTKQKRAPVKKRSADCQGQSMKITEVLAKLEKHEAECNLRYQRIEEKLVEQKQASTAQQLSLKGLDLKIWGLAVLIIIVPIIHKFLS
tara:strand:- start:4178 stop:4462 length:285 start_codon:yes stop_codon:yes gene_type:complete